MAKDSQDLSWKRMSFKANKVWAQTDETGGFHLVNGKVLIKYNLEQDYEYRVNPESLKPEDQAVPSAKKTTGPKNKKAVNLKKESAVDIPADSIRIYTDGASSGNPGPSGIGVLMVYKDNRKELSQYIGNATNNIAELTAIKVALEMLKRNDLPVRIFTDSSYALGLLKKGWKPKKNQELVSHILDLLEKFSDLDFVKVKGHAGVKENEVADYLATSAIKKGRV